MANALFVPRADLVDDAIWFETAQAIEASSALWRLLAVAREDPPRWIPRVVLCGEPGVGKTALARRFVKATQRSVACDLAARTLADLDMGQVRRDQETRDEADFWAEQMVRVHGQCPRLCSPAAWIPKRVLATILKQAQQSHPTEMLDMSVSQHTTLGFYLPRAWQSPGNDANDPLKRTSLALVDNADRLLRVSKTKRMACLDQMEHVAEPMGRRVVNVYVGSPDLAEALAECGATQVVALRPMPCDATFAKVADMVFGSFDAEALPQLHRATSGPDRPPAAPRRHARSQAALRSPRGPDPEAARTDVAPEGRRMSGGSDRSGDMGKPRSGRKGVHRPSGLDQPGAGDPWDPRAFADPIRTPTMRERAAIVADRAARADALVGRAPHLAHGAGLVASVAAIRMAVTPARSQDEHGFKAGFLRDHCDRTDRQRRDRLAPLVEAALEAEVDRRRWDGLGVAGPGHGFAIHQGATRAVPMESAAAADRRISAARWLDACPDNALHATGLLLAEMRRLAGRGSSIEGVRRCLGDVAFALCLGTAASVDDADLRIALSGLLLDGLQADDPSRHVIRRGTDLERLRWGAAVGGEP